MVRRGARGMSPSVAALVIAWRSKAEQLERFAPAAAVAFRDAALELETALRVDADAVLTLQEAALASSYSVDHLRHLLASGALRNVGQKRRPRVRAGDLPRKASTRTSRYDPNADALRLVGRRPS